jgi:hypothetical protein
MTVLYGKWTLKVMKADADYLHRVIISGSNGSNGTYPLVVGTMLSDVAGNGFSVMPQARLPRPDTPIWADSDVWERMGWDNAVGLQATISCSHNPPIGDDNYDTWDLVILCTSEDEELQSPLRGPRPDLTIPKKYALPGKVPPDRRRRPRGGRRKAPVR